MSASASAFEAAVNELALALPGINATRYLSIAGLVVLLYDHLLLLPVEISQVWAAQWSSMKVLFLVNRYLIPACLIVGAHITSGMSASGLSTSIWLPTSAFIGVTSLAIANIFVIQRVWALWGRNDTIRKVLVGAFLLVYIATYVSTAVAFYRLIPQLAYSPELKTCVILFKPRILLLMYALPLTLDVMIFALTCWNAFDRPRHMQTAITKQLVTDGVVYFVCLLSLRVFNIIITAVADTSYSQLGVYFMWAMITVFINRMLITSGIVEIHPGPDPSGRETPFKLPYRASYADDDDYDDDDVEAQNSPYQSFPVLDIKPYRTQAV